VELAPQTPTEVLVPQAAQVPLAQSSVLLAVAVEPAAHHLLDWEAQFVFVAMLPLVRVLLVPVGLVEGVIPLRRPA
jgi:hypothetical protein